ncbi:ATP-binding protein [Kordiimonas gwangyangensis]|uniref:ATP-binding protein n=1 Tax=Kordiimonas gwangyangensis TaxID=288022 RepID=UPI00035F69DC|nr:ATP-binding protein [Kordiimonas gwangyangensis]
MSDVAFRSGKKRRLGFRVKGVITLLLLLLGFVSALAYTSLRQFTDQITRLSEQSLPALSTTMELTVLLESVLQNAERLMIADVQAERRIAYGATKDSIDVGTTLVNEGRTVAATKDLKAILSVLSTTADDLNTLIEEKINAANKARFEREEFNAWAVEGLRTSTNDGSEYLMWVNDVRALVLQSASLNPGSNARMQRRDVLAINRRLTALEKDIASLPAPVRGRANSTISELKERLQGETGLITTLNSFNQLELRSEALARQMRVIAGELLREANSLSATESSNAQTSTNILVDRAEQELTWLILAVAVAVMIAGGSILYIDRKVISRLSRLTDAVNSQASGQSASIPVEDNDEITEIASAVRYFVDEIEKRQKRLRQSAEQVRDVIRQSPQAMCIVVGKTLLFHNDAFAKLWSDFKDRELVLNLMPSEHLEDTDNVIKTVRHKVSFDGHADRYFDLASTLADWEGKRARQFIMIEVTNQVHVEETLLAAREKAEMAATAKSSFLAMMSHEIRSPMNGIISVAEILERSKLGKDQRQLVNVINQSAETLLTIIDDILDLSKIEAGKLTIDHFGFNLHDVIGSVADLLRPTFDQKALPLKVTLAPNLPTNVVGDANRLRQILFNLLGNAAKFTESGSVEIAANLTGSPTAWKREVSISVTDSGIGISEAVMERLFQPFEQADSSVARQYGGTGLGLTICRRLAQLMKGDISVKSEVGKGSVFTLTLPFELASSDADVSTQKSKALRTPRASKVPASEATKTKSAPAQARHVLVVEDNRINQLVIGKILSELSCSFDTADDGLLALEKMEGARYDMILTDLRMPNMDGFALARAIRAKETTGQRMPIVAVSADAMEDARDLSTRSGIDAFLTKPIKLEEIRQCLDTYIA